MTHMTHGEINMTYTPAQKCEAPLHRPEPCPGCHAESRELLDAAARIDKVNGRCRDCRGGPVWPIPDLATARRVQWAAEDAAATAESEATAREAERRRAAEWPVERIRALMAEQRSERP